MASSRLIVNLIFLSQLRCWKGLINFFSSSDFRDVVKKVVSDEIIHKHYIIYTSRMEWNWNRLKILSLAALFI